MAAAALDPARPGPPDPRFSVHRNNVVAGLIAALGETFPAVRRLVGEGFFAAAAAAFVRAHPPRSPVLLRWGGAFAGWLAAFPPAAGLPWLSDVARLEWARCEAFHAADVAPVGAADVAPVGAKALSALDPGALASARLVAHPSLRLVASRFAVASLWADVTGPRRGLADLGRPETALVVRPDWTVETRALPAPAAAFLAMVVEGRPLGEIAAAGVGGGPGGAPAFDLGEQLAAAFAAGLVVAAARGGP
ncbi:Putative DNA-binding domain-containing protein [Rubrimonas cliftonensis]|uniref:Putative DNA-binding domain-containing protein n=2 Tax=Rubrimonas cliftonensis TaxID=89524 RepID=A0A1H3YRC8_9RHOB|nr:Putative DNA-binding domain-containing protein [Rubrimonas cliftonensis]